MEYAIRYLNNHINRLEIAIKKEKDLNLQKIYKHRIDSCLLVLKNVKTK